MLLEENDLFKNAECYNDDDLLENIEMPEDHSLNSSLPCSTIVTNLPYQLFDDTNEKKLLEDQFKIIDPDATFHYFKSFRRVRINFTTPDQAKQARRRFNNIEYKGQTVKCYLTQPIIIGRSSHLEPPKREKQFLISPPASPPVGWEPMDEAEPIINYDLLSAIAGLTPGEAHELHPPTEDQPAIVVHICQEDLSAPKSGLRIQRTNCPNR